MLPAGTHNKAGFAGNALHCSGGIHIPAYPAASCQFSAYANAVTGLPAPLRYFLIKHFERYLLYYLDLPTHAEVLRIWNSARGLAALMEGDGMTAVATAATCIRTLSAILLEHPTHAQPELDRQSRRRQPPPGRAVPPAGAGAVASLPLPPGEGLG